MLKPKEHRFIKEITFADLAAVINMPENPATRHIGRGEPGDTKWFGQSWETAKEYFQHGQPNAPRSMDKTAREMLNKLQILLPMETTQAYVHDYTGDEVDVPAYLAGEAQNMIQHVSEEESRHFNIFVEISTNCDSNPQQSMRRGAVITALIEYLCANQKNNVRLMLSGCLKANAGNAAPNAILEYKNVKRGNQAAMLLEVSTKPLDRDLIRYCLTDVSFFRRIVADWQNYALGRDIGMDQATDLNPKEDLEPQVIYFGATSWNKDKFDSDESALKYLESLANGQIQEIMKGAPTE